MVLVEGEKYLSIRLSTGKAQELIFKAIHDGKKDIDFSAFKNEKHEENLQSPNYRGESCAVWINKKKSNNNGESE
jgi:hypothetical protein